MTLDILTRCTEYMQGTKPYWIRCNYGINFTNDVPSSLQYHFSLTSNGYRALVYRWTTFVANWILWLLFFTFYYLLICSGDHDMTVPYLGTQAWIRSLNFSIVDDWRSWWVDNQIAGWDYFFVLEYFRFLSLPWFLKMSFSL